MSMFSIRRPTAALLLTAFVSSQFATLGCASVHDDDGGSLASQDQALSFDGETLFRGLFFGTGAAAVKLPELWGNTATAALVTKALQTSPTSAATQLRQYVAIARSEGASSATLTRLSKAADLLQVTRLSQADFANRLGQARDTLSSDAVATRVIASIRSSKPTFFVDFAAAIQSGDRARVATAVSSARAVLVDTYCGSVPRLPIPHPWPSSVDGNPSLAASVVVDVETAIYAVAVVAVAVVAVAVLFIGISATDVSRLQADKFIDLVATRFRVVTVAAPVSGQIAR